ncbi:hypothetical protein, partial [Akkermansia sp.]|uniref:hypothetical protein n=1 Tax=Akkermansia sp. TaxID=1872421 RepID=UPI003AB4D9BB
MVEKIRKGKEKGEVSPMGQMPLSIIQDGPFQAFISSIAPWPFHSGAEACIFKLPQPISTLFKYSWLVTARLIRAKRKSGTASLYWPCHFRMEAVPIPQGQPIRSSTVKRLIVVLAILLALSLAALCAVRYYGRQA